MAAELASDSGAPADSRLRRGWALLRHHMGVRRAEFFTAVGAAAVFATCTVLSAWAIQRVVDEVILPRFDEGPQGWPSVLAGVGLVLGVGVLRASAVVVRRTFAGRAQFGTERAIIGRLTEAIQAQPLSWIQRRSSGDLIARVGVDAEASVGVMAPLPFASSTVLLIVISSVALMLTDVVLGLVAIALFPLLGGLNVAYQRTVGRHYDEAQEHLGRLSSAVHESFEGVVVVKAFGAESREADRLATIASHLRRSRVSAAIIKANFETLLDAVPTASNVLLVLLGAIRVRDGAMTVGQVVLFVYLFTLLVLPLRLIGYALSEMPHSLAGWGRVREILDEPTAPDPASAVGSVTEPGVGVVLDGVRFSYEPGREVLCGVDLPVGRGRTVALVGATGSGKSTLLQLVAGIRQADSGLVAREPGPCALVFQEAFLLSGTIRDNILLGADVDPALVEQALDLASADFVRALPDGLDTVVGERGVTVSGGQRQRIALARALVREPRVLILDDTTSALDPGTEAAILARLATVLADVTTLIVASRPSTIALADEIAFLADGRIAAFGPHAELLATEPAYRRLVEAYEHDRAAGPESGGERS